MTEFIQTSDAKYPFLPLAIPVIQQQWPEEVLPLVSISCATYLHENFIRDAIEGFLMQQTNFKIEILIHDDASSDKTAEIVREYEYKYPQLIIATYQIENQFKKNPKTSKYVTPPERKGKYIALCEGDDYWTDPLKLQKQVDFLETYGEYVMCFHKAIIRNERVTPILEQCQTIDFKNINIDLRFILTIWSIPTASIVFRRIDGLTNKPWLNKVWSGDIALVGLLYKYGKIGYLDYVMSVYRMHPGGITLSHKGRGMIKQRMILYNNLDKYFEYKHKDDIRYAKKYVKQEYAIRLNVKYQLAKEIRRIKYIILIEMKKVKPLLSLYRYIKRKDL